MKEMQAKTPDLVQKTGHFTVSFCSSWHREFSNAPCFVGKHTVVRLKSPRAVWQFFLCQVLFFGVILSILLRFTSNSKVLKRKRNSVLCDKLSNLSKTHENN